jgi:glycosyltransferase involved in cell wall biosynthesis
MLEELRRAGVPDDAYRITSAAPEHVGDHLAVASFAICFCHPKPSLIAASPTKVGEYLAAGLPVVSGPGVGDTDAILRGERAGVVVEEFTEDAYEQAARELLEMGTEPDARRRCRDVAERRFSLAGVGIPRYDALYRRIMASSDR